MSDPEHFDFTLQPESPAIGYGCQSFGGVRNISSKPMTRDAETFEPKSRSIFVGGEISEDTFWNADSVFVTGSIQILDNVTVTIAAGAVLSFTDYFSIEVDGCLKAIGTAENRIVFTAQQSELFQWDDGQEGAWNQILFLDTSENNEISRFEYCIFEFSKAFASLTDFPFAGGVFYLQNTSNLKIENSIFRNNYAELGGAIACFFNSNPTISNSLFHNNKASLAGSSIYNSDSYPIFINNTITANETENQDAFFATGSIHNFNSKPYLLNNIVQQNEVYYFEDLQVVEQKLFYAFYNNIGNFYTQNGNISSDPMFFNPTNGQFHLQADSPCIDAGFVFEGFSFPEFDLAGNSRISGSSLDMGAFEYYSESVSDEYILASSHFSLQNYPNPFNPSTTIKFSLPESANVHLAVFNIKGQKVRTLTDQFWQNGTHEVVWDGKDEHRKDAASGMYMYRLQVNGKTEAINKCVMMK